MVKHMSGNEMEYLKNSADNVKVVRTEILFTPLLIVLPLIVGYFLINDWYNRDFITSELELTGELMLGIIILAGNVMFDVPFIKFLLTRRKI
jgi:hypothetical protein